MRFLLNSSFGGTYQSCPSHPQRTSMISSPPSQTQQPFGSQEVCQGLESSHGWIYVPLQLPDLPHLSLQIKQRWQVKKMQKSRKVEMSLDTSTGLSFKGWKGSLLRNWCKLMQPSVSWMDTRHFSISFFLAQNITLKILLVGTFGALYTNKSTGPNWTIPCYLCHKSVTRFN